MDELHIRLRLTFFNNADPDALGFGTGIVRLLELIDETGSIRQACASMGMAYSKSWKIITRTEAEFNINLLKRTGRGGSELTGEARELIANYYAVLEAARNAAEEKFHQLYGKTEIK